jgi:peptidyl-tRNA hydrolase, PTH1 family
LERDVKLVVGLGNPGSRYASTRHNVGFMVADRLAKRWGASVTKKQCGAQVGSAEFDGERIWLAKPQTFMNLSGEAVSCLLHFYRLTPADLLVIYDERDLPVGRIRLRERGSAGGHRGVASIIQMVGTNEFPRVRIGIGRPADMDAVDHVLSGFPPEERPLIEDAIVRAVQAVEDALHDGLATAMNKYNG